MPYILNLEFHHVRKNSFFYQKQGQLKITVRSLESIKNDHEFEHVSNETMDTCIKNNIDEPRKRKVPVRYGGEDITSTTLSVKDNIELILFILYWMLSLCRLKQNSIKI